MTVTLQFWMLPILVMVVSFFWAQRSSNAGGYLPGMFEFLIAIFVSMAAWIVYLLAALFLGIR